MGVGTAVAIGGSMLMNQMAGNKQAGAAGDAASAYAQMAQKAIDKQEGVFGNTAAWMQQANLEANSQISPYSYGGLKAYGALNESMGLGNPATTGYVSPEQLDKLYTSAVKFINEDQFGKGSGATIDPNNPLDTIQQAVNLVRSSGALTDRTYNHGSADNLYQMYLSLGGTPGMDSAQFAYQNNLQGWKIDPTTGKTTANSVPTSSSAASQNANTNPLSNYQKSAQAQLAFGANPATAGAQGGMAGFTSSPFATLVGGYDPNKSLAENFKVDPGYQFAQDEARRNLESSASASGLLQSSSFTKDLDKYTQGIADQQYQQWMGNLNNAYGNYMQTLGTSYGDYQNQLMQLSGLGYNSANQSGQNSMSTATNVGNVNMHTADQQQQALLGIGTSNANSELAKGAAQAGALMNNSSLLAGLGNFGLSKYGQTPGAAGTGASFLPTKF